MDDDEWKIIMIMNGKLKIIDNQLIIVIIPINKISMIIIGWWLIVDENQKSMEKRLVMTPGWL